MWVEKHHRDLLDARLRRHIAKEQSVDQAAYRPGFSCEDHLFTLVILCEKAAEWNIPVWAVAVDFKKAFDSVEHPGIWKALREQGIHEGYINLLQ